MSNSNLVTIDMSDFARVAYRIEAYAKNILPKKVKGLIDRMVRTGEQYAVNTVGHIDTGATLASVMGYRNGDKGVIVADGAAVWIEFGTGVVANAGNAPHPKAGELGMSAWGTYGQGKGANLNGWWYEGDDGEYHHTMGIPANRFMYNTAQMLIKECPEWAKEIFKP